MMRRMEMNRTPTVIALAAFAIVLCGNTVMGHHSFAQFDMVKSDTIKGVVKEVQWTNPHSWIQVMVTDGSGKAVEWSIEGSSPSAMLRRGWKPKTLVPGDEVTVIMHPLRDGKPGGALVAVILANGQRIGDPPAPGPPPTSQTVAPGTPPAR